MSDIQSTYSTLTEIDKLLSDIELKIDNISGKVGTDDGGGGVAGGSLSLREQFHVLNVSMIAVQKFAGSGNANLDQIINKVQTLTAMFMRLHMLMFAIEEAEAGALGPLGWVYAGANAVGFGMSLSTLGQ